MKIQYLFEKAMNQSIYSETMDKLGDSAKIGFEFEIFVPCGGTNNYVECYSIQPNEFSLEELEELFDEGICDTNNRRALFSTIEGDFHEQLLDIASQNLANNTKWIKKFASDEEYENSDISELRDKYCDVAMDAELESLHDTYELVDWYKDNFNSLRKFCYHYDIYVIGNFDGDNIISISDDDDDNEPDFGYASELVQTALSDALGEEVHIQNNYSKSNYKYWKLVPDGSIDDDSSGAGVEIVSPPIPAEDAFEKLEQVFDCIEDGGYKTNSSTGLHINISIPDMADKIDPLKLVLFMGDKHILKVFDREHNTYTESQIDILKKEIIRGKLNKSTDIIKDMCGLLSREKYSSVNLSKLFTQGFIEFRSAGGANYHKKLKEVKEVLGRLLTAIYIASNPEEEKEEYLKKVSKLVASGKEQRAVNSTTPNTLMDFLGDKTKMLDRYAGKDGEAFAKALISLILAQEPEQIKDMSRSRAVINYIDANCTAKEYDNAVARAALRRGSNLEEYESLLNAIAPE